MYFFTPLHMIRSNGQRVKRNTKHGFWRATQKCTNILDNSGNTIGVKMPLCDAPKPGGPLTTRQPAEYS